MGSDYLFAQPSFVSGVARALDIGGTFDSYNYSKTPEDADHKAISLDWKLIGQDLWSAIDRYRSESTTPDEDAENPTQLSLSLG